MGFSTKGSSVTRNGQELLQAKHESRAKLDRRILQIPPTTESDKQVSEAEELVSLFRHQTLNFLELTLLHKTLKAARLAIANRVVLNLTNTELLAANKRKK